MACRRIGLVVHQGRETAVEVGRSVQDWADRKKVAVSPVDVWAQDWSQEQRRHAREEARRSGHPDLIVTVGGDGTFLRGARVAVIDDAPVLGVNVGRVGFLTEIEPHEVQDALDAFDDGRARIEERLALTMRASRPLSIPSEMEEVLCYGRGPMLPPPPQRDHDGGGGVELDVTALNDVVLEKLTRDRQAGIGVYVDGELVASYSADALVVSSPTGSTAYSFAAGGPVLSPRVRALVVTPVAPHMVFNRSLVLSSDEQIALRVLRGSGQIVLSVDGQARGVLDPDDWIVVHPAPRPVRLVRTRSTSFYARLRDRFALSDAPAATGSADPRR